MNWTWDKIKAVAYTSLERKGLNGLYRKRLDFELAEIEKQGAATQWLTIVTEKQVFDSNPNQLLLPYLLGRVKDNPIAGLVEANESVAISCKYQYIMDLLKKNDKLPAGIIRDPDNPDIDIDCLPEARDEIKAYAADRYSAGIDDGYGAVCDVSTWTTYLFRSAIADVAKTTSALIDDGETGWCTKTEAIELTKVLPDEVDDLKDNGMSLCKGKVRSADGTEVDCKRSHDKDACPYCHSTDTEGPTIGKLLKENQDLACFYGKYPKVIDMAVRLVGRIRSMGKHAGALIIADRPLYGALPMYRRAGSGKQAIKETETRWLALWTEGRSTQLSKFGFTKWDILGLKNLRYMYECCKMIEENHGLSFGPGHGFGDGGGWNDIDPDDDDDELRSYSIKTAKIPGRLGHYFDAAGNKVKLCLNDQRALDLANQLRTDAVFQFDTDLAKRILANGVRHFYDLMIFNAMGHPGPMAMIPDYVKRRDDPKQEWRRDEHPLIAETLAATHGTICFQEQLQALWQNVAGFTAPEAQEGRKAVAKKWKDKLRPIEQKWLSGAGKVIGREKAEEWWQKQITFGRYAFNMSHGVSYCLVAYRCLLLKAYFPHEWWSSVMGYCNPDKLVRYMNVARAEGVEFKTVSVSNLSSYFKAVVVPRQRHDDGESIGHVVPGLLGIKGVGEKGIDQFVVAGDYKSLDDYVERCGKNKTLMERLIKLGAFSHLDYHSNLKALWTYYQYRYCSGTDITALRRQINADILAKAGWTEETIEVERNRHIAAYKHQFPKRKKIPASIAKWKPVPKVTIKNLVELYPDDYNLDDVLAFEEEFLGYTIHSPLQRFVIKGGCSIEEAKEHGELEAMIVTAYKTKTKTDRPMCRLTVTDGIQTAVVMLWEDNLVLQAQSMLKRGIGFRALVRWDSKRNNFTVNRGCPFIRLTPIDLTTVQPHATE